MLRLAMRLAVLASVSQLAAAQPELSLSVVPAARCVRPGDPVIMHMDVSRLSTKVNACQAMLGYSSTYFANPGTNGCITAGGGVWDLVIWDSWKDSLGIPGQIDTAIGVNAQGSTGTDADGTVAVITLKAGTTEGTTSLIFRPDFTPDPGLTQSTFLASVAGTPVWPVKQNSPTVIIDGTAPHLGTITATNNGLTVKDSANIALPGPVVITVPANDELSGLVNIPTVILANGARVENVVAVSESPPGTFNYLWPVTTATSNGTWSAIVIATDRSGNVATRTFTVRVDLTSSVGDGIPDAWRQRSSSG